MRVDEECSGGKGNRTKETSYHGDLKPFGQEIYYN